VLDDENSKTIPGLTPRLAPSPQMIFGIHRPEVGLPLVMNGA